LHVIPIHLPPLRERGDDVLLIANKFLADYSAEERKSFVGLSPECEAIFTQYEWLGNIRELQNVMRNIVVMNQGKYILPDMLCPALKTVDTLSAKPRKEPMPKIETEKGREQTEILPLWKVEKEEIEKAIRYCNDNIPNAAALLGVSPSTIYRKIQGWQRS
jgi:two-component system repressor protein LuxO